MDTDKPDATSSDKMDTDKSASDKPADGTADKSIKKKGDKKGDKKVTAKKLIKKYIIDCTEPHNDDIFDITSFEKFLHEKLKVNGKAGVLGDSVIITKEGSCIHVTVNIAFSKRYLKYLTKKFLKKQQLRDYIRVIARAKNNFYLRYFNFQTDEQEEE